MSRDEEDFADSEFGDRAGVKNGVLRFGSKLKAMPACWGGIKIDREVGFSSRESADFGPWVFVETGFQDEDFFGGLK